VRGCIFIVFLHLIGCVTPTKCDTMIEMLGPISEEKESRQRYLCESMSESEKDAMLELGNTMGQ